MEKHKTMELLKGASYIAGFWVVYLLVNELLIYPVMGALTNIIASELIANNQSFFALLVCLFLISALVIIVIPKLWRGRAYKLILVASILIVAIDAFPITNPWDSTFPLVENLKIIVSLAFSFISQLSITLLLLSIIEYCIKADLKNSIISNKKLLILLVVVAIISMLITFGIYITYPLQLGWTI